MLQVTKEQIKEIEIKYKTPAYIYLEKTLEENAKKFLELPNAYGITVRYAMKALPTKEILKIFCNLGLHIDASSIYEVYRAINAGIKPEKIQITAQELPQENMKDIKEKGVLLNACSITQIEDIGKIMPGIDISIRINPGLGAGSTNKVNVGGPSSSFGIWHEQINEAKETAKKYNLKITRIHSHIGSGNEPEIWKKISAMTIAYAELLSEVKTINLGGGFKIDRMNPEKIVSIQDCAIEIKKLFQQFYKKTGRKLHLEVEPGTYLVANAGFILSKIIDIVSTDKYKFIKLDTGMTEIIRPTLYTAQHPIYVITDNKEKDNYVIVGHCCESGDLLTPSQDNPGAISTREILKPIIGDLILIGGAGAYCSGMSVKNYNSFPEAPEVLITKYGKIKLIRKRQTLNQITQNEL